MRISLDENFTGEQTTLKQLEVEQAHKVLCILTEPTGTDKAQLRYMCDKALEWNKETTYSLLT